VGEEGKRLALELGQFVLKAATSLEEKAAMKKKIRESLKKRVKLVIAEMRKERSHQAIGDYLDLRRTVTDVDETWSDFGRTIGKAALHITGHAVAHGLGLTTKKSTFSRVIGAAKKKKKYNAAKVGKKAKIAGNAGSLAAPIKMDRREFNKRLKAAGNRLNKTSLS
jgi:hypothetical protein